MNEGPKQRWGCLQWGGVMGTLGLLVWLAQSGSTVPKMGNQMKAVNNCKAIILVLKPYSMDHDSSYPGEDQTNVLSSNQAFRELFKEQIITDERVFGCPTSLFNSDNNSGRPPDFEDALRPGECHWMLLRGQTAHSHAKMPLIIENSLNADWPPKWDVTPPEGLRKRGQAWPGRKIIIERNDGSVALEKLRPDGTLDWHTPNNLGPDGKSWIDSLTPEQIVKLAYWDIEEK